MTAPTHLTVLRSSALLACERHVWHPIDADLDALCGMDGNLARRLQAARDLHGEVGVARMASTRRLVRSRSKLLNIDADLDREAGMDGDYAVWLQTARDLDAGTV